MADLEFVTIDHYSSSDEIGQLSNSLNEMSANLQRTMKDLHRANEQLKVELLRRKEIEEKRRELFAMISGVCQASCRINTSLHILDITDLPLTLSLCQHGSGL
jgi:methyl-accepting chemotaxis protein